MLGLLRLAYLAHMDGFDSALLDTDEITMKIIDIREKTPANIFIDALGECFSDQRYLLLKALEILLDKSLNLVKLFVSSRDDMDIVGN